MVTGRNFDDKSQQFLTVTSTEYPSLKDSLHPRDFLVSSFVGSATKLERKT